MKRLLSYSLILCLILCACSSEPTNEITDDTSGKIKEHAYVDLGLPSGIKWATCNIGASKPTKYGDYFAWSETSKKREYTSDITCFGVSYDDLFLQGITDANHNLTAKYDAANSNWGGTWRMPTLEDITELCEICTFEWTDSYNDSGTAGYIVTGPNGNSIFLPAAGGKEGTQTFKENTKCTYWSATSSAVFANSDDKDHSEFSIVFAPDLWADNGFAYSWRYVGYPVRPVSN